MNSTSSDSPEDVVGAVAVVDVPVEDQHPLDAQRGDRMTRGDGDVVEQAEAHRPVRHGVVSRWAMRAEAHLPGAAVDQPANQLHRAAGGVQGRGRRSRR